MVIFSTCIKISSKQSITPVVCRRGSPKNDNEEEDELE